MWVRGKLDMGKVSKVIKMIKMIKIYVSFGDDHLDFIEWRYDVT